MSLIERLFSSAGERAILDPSLSRLPYASPGLAKEFRRFRAWPTLADIFASGHQNCWLAQQGRLAPTSEALNGSMNLPTAVKGFAEGFSIVVRHSEQANQQIRDVAAEFADYFSSRVDVQLYWTPASRTGFDWHYDLDDVFIIQCFGEKEFYLRQNKEPRPVPFDPRRNGGHFSSEMKGPEIRCLLRAGDTLYIPSGFWHKATALTDSFHLSVGVDRLNLIGKTIRTSPDRASLLL